MGGSAFTSFGYLGGGSLSTCCAALVVGTTLTDTYGDGKSKERVLDIKTKCIFAIEMILVIGLVWTALYISFTGVGANTVAGMHDRYVFPLIFPILYFIGVDGGRHAINKNVFACLPMFIIALTFLYNINMLCVSQY